jgi:hypothetical protein
MLSNRDAVVLLGHNVERDLLQRRVHVDRRSAQVQLDVWASRAGAPFHRL